MPIVNVLWFQSQEQRFSKLREPNNFVNMMSSYNAGEFEVTFAVFIAHAPHAISAYYGTSACSPFSVLQAHAPINQSLRYGICNYLHDHERLRVKNEPAVVPSACLHTMSSAAKT